MKNNNLDDNSNKRNHNIEGNILSDIPEDLRKKMKDLEDRYGLNVDLRKETWNSFYLKTGKIYANLLKNESDKNTLLQFASIVDEHFVEIFINPHDFEINFYNEFKEKIELAYKKNAKATDEVLMACHKKLGEKYYYPNVIQSILIYRELYENVGNLIKNKPLRGRFDEYEEIIKKIKEIIEKSEEKKFKMYFFDYILKFGYLVEAYIKEILILYLKLSSIIDDTKRPNYETINNEEAKNLLTIGRVLNYLDNYDSKIDKEISKLRNSIFHSSFVIEYQIDFQERNIIFYDRDKIIKKKIDEIILTFDYFIKIIHSFYITFPKVWGVRNLFEYMFNQI